MENKPQLCVIVPAIVAAIGTAILFAVGAGGWPGVVGSSGMEFCEALRPGMIKQPANTWSNLSYVAAGLIVGWYAWREQDSRSATTIPASNRIRSTVLYPMLYATTAALVGPCSMALHATATTWGGQIDILSMFAWAGFALMYALTRLLDWSRTRFAVAYLALLVLLAAAFLTQNLPNWGSLLFGFVLAAFVFVEWLVRRQRPAVGCDWRWLAATAAVFALSFGIWFMSRTGNPWCSPESLLQGHAIWHILDGVAMVTLYWFFRSEGAGRLAAA